MEGLDLGRNESHADIRAKKCRIGLKLPLYKSFSYYHIECILETPE